MEKSESGINMNFPTPVEEITVSRHCYRLKRDDLTHPDFSGNKARKFHTLLRSDLDGVRKIVSYGSNQSNAMYSLSVLAKAKGVEFEYHVDHIPRYLKKNPVGNYRAALENGTCFVEDGLKKAVNSGDGILFVEEGGRQKESEEGIRVLAEEIVDWQKEQGIGDLTIFLPSGTGTTALYLQKNCSLLTAGSTLRTSVFTTPCVGDSTYLKRQFSMLESDESYWPAILDLPKKYHFGKLYREFYEIWLKLRRECGVEFDMLYDPKGWMVMETFRDILGNGTLYIHQGGIKGNESMLERYRRKFASM
jgi:1-aminocyclopropane-1-carboxylate deaminase/D-cysteine desulfhydrase-like pyridoxal-dependent ACC family enzyme